MDQTVREAARLLQASGDFTSLTEILNLENLDHLIQQAALAKLSLMGFESEILHVPSLPFSIEDPNLKQPRKIHTSKICLAYLSLPKVPLNIAELPELVLKVYHQCHRSPHLRDMETAKEPLQWHEPGHESSEFAYLGSVVCATTHTVSQARERGGGIVTGIESRHSPSPDQPVYYVEFNLADIWRESSDSFQKYKNKKLRERGLIPGRRG